MEKMYPRSSRTWRLLWSFTAISIAIGTLLLRAQDSTLLSLGVGDVHKAVILVTKPGAVILELTYSKPKQAEFLKASQTGLPKKIQIALNGQIVSERTIAKPLSGHSIKVPMTSVDDAFARALALMPLLKSAAPAPLPAAAPPPGDVPVFSVSSDSISKFALSMYIPERVWIDLALDDKQRTEFAQLSAKNSGGKIQLSLNGKIVGELQPPSGKAGSSVRLALANVDQAMAVAKSLMGKSGNAN
jgi:hypothetical protein